MSEQQQSRQYMTMVQYVEKNKAERLTEVLAISHRRNVNFFIMEDQYRSKKVDMRDGYVDHETKIEVVGKGLSIPLKDWPAFMMKMVAIDAILTAKGLIPKE